MAWSVRSTGLIAAAFSLAVSMSPAIAADQLQTLIAGPQRTEPNRVRDPYRHPLETLKFFHLRDNMKVVEIWPGGSGWWTEILAPYLSKHGKLYEALPNPASSNEAKRGNEIFAAKMAAAPDLYGKVIATTLDGDHNKIAPDNSVDLVLIFRNLHDWVPQGTADGALKAVYRALKPGGVLGIEDHRAANNQPQDPTVKSGYLREDYTIALMKRAGFKFAGKSEVNANPKDTKDYPSGVWTLPPTLRLKDQDRDKYVAIGESDRYTMKFVKPR